MSNATGCARCVTPAKCAVHGCCPGTWPAESTAKTNAQRQAALKARRKAAGLVPVTVWVYEHSKGAVKAFAGATVEAYEGLTKIKTSGKMPET